MNFQLIGITAFISLLIGAFGGYEFEANRFEKFRVQQQAIAMAQKERVAKDEKADKTITSSIVSEFNSSIASLQHNPNSGRLSAFSHSTKGIDARTTYSILVDKCTQTTIQLNYLQKWVAEQYKQDESNN